MSIIECSDRIKKNKRVKNTFSPAAPMGHELGIVWCSGSAWKQIRQKKSYIYWCNESQSTRLSYSSKQHTKIRQGPKLSYVILAIAVPGAWPNLDLNKVGAMIVQENRLNSWFCSRCRNFRDFSRLITVDNGAKTSPILLRSQWQIKEDSENRRNHVICGLRLELSTRNTTENSA